MKNVLKKLNVLVLLIGMLGMVTFMTSCEEDKCEGVTCQNDGICIDGTCDCPDGYSGTNCETHCSAGVIGIYTITGGTNGGDAWSTIEIKAGSTNKEALVALSTSSFLTPDYTGTLSDDCSTLTLDTYPEGGGFQMLNGGTITFNGNSLSGSFDYSIDDFTITAEK